MSVKNCVLLLRRGQNPNRVRQIEDACGGDSSRDQPYCICKGGPATAKDLADRLAGAGATVRLVSAEQCPGF